MAHKKGLGSSRNGRDSKPRCSASRSSPASRSRAARSSSASAAPSSAPATGVGIGRDHTIYARSAGTVQFTEGRRGRVISVEPRRRVGAWASEVARG